MKLKYVAFDNSTKYIAVIKREQEWSYFDVQTLTFNLLILDAGYHNILD